MSLVPGHTLVPPARSIMELHRRALLDLALSHTPGPLPVPKLDRKQYLAAMTAAWPGREAALSWLCGCISHPAAKHQPLVLWGRPRSGKSSVLSHLFSYVGCAAGVLPCDQVESYRDLYESALHSLADGVVRLAKAGAGAAGPVAGVWYLMRQLTHPSRGVPGLYAAATLVRWYFDPTGALRALFQMWVNKHYAAGVATSSSSAHSGTTASGGTASGVRKDLLSSTSLTSLIGHSRCVSLTEFSDQLSMLSKGLQCGDVRGEGRDMRAPATAPLSLWLVFDRAERLSGQDPRLLPQLLLLSRQHRLNCVFVSAAPTVVLEPQRAVFDHVQPLVVEWPAPARAAAESLLIACRPAAPAAAATTAAAASSSVVAAAASSSSSSSGSSAEQQQPAASTGLQPVHEGMWRNYVDRLLTAFGLLCGWDVCLLHYLAHALWPYYKQPVDAGIGKHPHTARASYCLMSYRLTNACILFCSALCMQCAQVRATS